jgi:predicted O-methyltransferase YrrM
MSEKLDYRTVQSYLESLVPPREPQLALMETHAAHHAFPIIGPACGQVCYLLARVLGARRVFELGSGYGYSSAWFARAVRENGGGEVHHTVWDAALSDQARAHLQALGYGDLMRWHVGEAVAALAAEPGPFDIVFSDIDKELYPGSLPVIRSRVRIGGLLIVDNLLWHGRIFDPDDHSESTEGIRRFTAAITGDGGWTVSVLPLRDGLLVARRDGPT